MTDEEAYAAARLLLVIPGFFESSVPVVAVWLQQHCRDNEQARRIAWAACESQSEWKGLPGLVQILNAEAQARASVEDDRKLERWKAEADEPPCPVCNDRSWVRASNGVAAWCECPFAQRMRESAPKLLDLLNGKLAGPVRGMDLRAWRGAAAVDRKLRDL